MKTLMIVSSIVLLSGCAQLHHVQVGEIHSHPDYVQKPFDIKFSETGVNIGEAARTSKIFLKSSQQKGADQIAAIIGLFQMGPRTGNPVYVKGYASNLMEAVYEKCPSGMVTGLVSVRESRKYPVISGEIVKLTGFCLMKKGT